MTKQETFDIVAKHLLTQNKRSVDHEYTDYRGVPKCMYRAPDGCKCAVGILIPDPDYRRWMEGAWLGISEIKNILERDCHDFGLCRRLQEIHDKKEVENWNHELRLLARDYDLTFKEDYV